MEITRLVRWAYVDEMPKGYHNGRLGIAAEICPMFSVASLGTRVDNSNWAIEPGYPASMGTQPHPDAVTIANAIHAMRDKPKPMLPGAPELLLGELAQYLTDEDRSKILPAQAGELVRMHAILGNTPIWRLEYCVIRKIGRQRKSLLRKGRGSARLQGELVLDETMASARAILEARFEYLAWHTALRELAGLQLREHQALPPTAPQQPWHNPSTIQLLPDRLAKPMDARALSRGRASALPFLPLAPKRRSPLPQRPAATHGPIRCLGYEDILKYQEGT